MTDTTNPEVPVYAANVTCHTEGCSNGEVVISVLAAVGGIVICGVCMQQITDITAAD
jgi:hypothetical protein